MKKKQSGGVLNNAAPNNFRRAARKESFFGKIAVLGLPNSVKFVTVILVRKYRKGTRQKISEIWTSLVDFLRLCLTKD